ncbi:MAG TPA: hypothetical protein VD903_10675 [Pseudonocardia sp.]|nr:hypothetical protein [Pseudonocardia sp.]
MGARATRALLRCGACGVAGLFQRLSIGIGLGWVTALLARAARA